MKSRAQLRRDRRFPKVEDDGLVCHPAARGGVMLATPEQVNSAHAQRMALVDNMKPEYRQLLNEFPRLPGGITEQLVQWSHANVPIDAARRTLREQVGPDADLPPLRMVRPRRPRGEPGRWSPPADVAVPVVEPLPMPSSAQSEAIEAVGVAVRSVSDVLKWAQDALRDMAGIPEKMLPGIRSALAEGDARRLSAIRKELTE